MSHSFLWGENKKKRKCWRFAFRGLNSAYSWGVSLLLFWNLSYSLPKVHHEDLYFHCHDICFLQRESSGGKVCKKWEQQGVWVKMNRKADDGRWITPWRTYARGWLWGNSRALSVSMRIPYLHILPSPLSIRHGYFVLNCKADDCIFNILYDLHVFHLQCFHRFLPEPLKRALRIATWNDMNCSYETFAILWDIMRYLRISCSEPKCPTFNLDRIYVDLASREKPSGMGSVLQCVDCQSMSKHVDTNISVGFATPNLSTNTGTSKIVKHGRVKMRINKSKNLQKRETRGNKKREPRNPQK